MEAKIEKRVIIRRYCGVVTTEQGSTNITLEYTYLSESHVDKCDPNSLIIMYDGELTENLVRKLIDTYSGEYAVFHVFKSDRFYLSDVTRYFREIFSIESEEVSNE